MGTFSSCGGSYGGGAGALPEQPISPQPQPSTAEGGILSLSEDELREVFADATNYSNLSQRIQMMVWDYMGKEPHKRNGVDLASEIIETVREALPNGDAPDSAETTDANPGSKDIEEPELTLSLFISDKRDLKVATQAITKLMTEARISELEALRAEYKELYQLSLIHGNPYEDCLDDWSWKEVDTRIQDHIKELRGDNKDG